MNGPGRDNRIATYDFDEFGWFVWLGTPPTRPKVTCPGCGHVHYCASSTTCREAPDPSQQQPSSSSGPSAPAKNESDPC